jgi:hypothetical protein
MDVKELTIVEIRAVIADMQAEAKYHRQMAGKARAAGKHDQAFRLMSDAIVTENWANRLDNAMSAHG